MNQTPSPSKPPLMHVARLHIQSRGFLYLFLRQIDAYRYVWFCEESLGKETETSIWGGSTEEAILAAYKSWAINEIRPLNCGFRYTLPERDEVGTNALFSQMMASYQSPTGVYFDEELSANCIVQFASLQARDLMKRLQQTGQV